MKKYIITIRLFIIAQTLGFGQAMAGGYDAKMRTTTHVDSLHNADSLYLSQIEAITIRDLELPKIGNEGQLIKHEGYSLLYDEANEQAQWVAYQLTKTETTKLYKRTDKFMPDPKVTTGGATNKDYEHSGYDRGHLAPAADMGWSTTATAESFYYCNMSPQVPSFNRGIWKKLEMMVRDWAIETGVLYIVTGPVITNGLPRIGPHKVAVPGYYFKVILEYGETGVKGIGFVLPNAGSNKPLWKYAVTIDIVEQITGIDFFPLLEDEQETIIERTVCLNSWCFR